MEDNPARPTDHTIEDLNRDVNTQAVGLFGRPSEIAWLHSLQMETYTHSGPAGHSIIFEYIPQSLANYYLDSLRIPISHSTDWLDRPPKEIAFQLVRSYFQIIHASFPVIGKVYFLKQLHTFYTKPRPVPGKTWMAVLNLVFAIASRHASLKKQESGDDMLYFSRAWSLCMREPGVLNHPNLQQVQVESLVSLYMLSLGHINR